MKVFGSQKYVLPITNLEYNPLPFGKFFRLEELKRKLIETVDTRDFNGFIFICKEILNLHEIKHFSNPIKTLLSILEIIRQNVISNEVFFLKTDGTENKAQKKENFLDFENRFLVYWYHLLFKNYGWTKEYVDNCDVNFIFLLLQELFINDFEEKEWQYRLSELAYSYDERTKKTKYHPLPKPRWMLGGGEIKTTKISKKFLPFGNIVDTTGGMGSYGEHINLVREK